MKTTVLYSRDSKPLTVGALRMALACIADDIIVVVADSNGFDICARTVALQTYANDTPPTILIEV